VACRSGSVEVIQHALTRLLWADVGSVARLPTRRRASRYCHRSCRGYRGGHRYRPFRRSKWWRQRCRAPSRLRPSFLQRQICRRRPAYRCGRQSEVGGLLEVPQCYATRCRNRRSRNRVREWGRQSEARCAHGTCRRHHALHRLKAYSGAVEELSRQWRGERRGRRDACLQRRASLSLARFPC